MVCALIARMSQRRPNWRRGENRRALTSHATPLRAIMTERTIHSGEGPMSVVSVYAVFADTDEAERIGRSVIAERLAACINIIPGVRSIYRWEDAIETSEEAAAIFKTTAATVDSLVTRI